MDLEPVVRAEGQEEDSPSLSHLLFLPNESDLGSSDIPSGPGSLCYKSGPDLDTHLEKQGFDCVPKTQKPSCSHSSDE